MLALTEFEMVNIRPEIDTERALKCKKNLNLPDNTVVVFFHQLKDITETLKGGRTNTKTTRIEENYGHYYVKDGKTYVDGYIHCMLDYKYIAKEKCRVMWPDVDNTRLAYQLFLLDMMRYKEKYKFQKLQKVPR